MQTQFFAIIKTDSHKDYALELIHRETILALVEQEFGGEARAKCENDPEYGIKSGVCGTAWNYLSGKYQMFELYDCNLSGSLLFLGAARGMGTSYELRAVELVTGLRDAITDAIERAMDSARSALIERESQNVPLTQQKAHVAKVRDILEADLQALKCMA